MPNPSPQVLAWEAPEFVHRTKGFGWQVLVWLIGLALAAFFLWSNGVNFVGIISAIVPLTGALALTTQGHRKPRLIRVSIDASGVGVDGHRYPWQELKSFWTVFTPDQQTLYLETTRRILSIVPIQLGKTDPELVRRALSDHLPEKTGSSEDFGDKLARLIQF